MAKGRGKLEFQEERIGDGPIAGPRDCVRVDVATFLHRGDSVAKPVAMVIDLARRDVVAGLRYGIEGMKLGGRRRIVCPPHLGYGVKGARSAGIPADALLIFVVELLEIVKPSPTDKPEKPASAAS